MKKFNLLLLFSFISLISFGKTGGYPDKIYYGVKMSSDVAVKDVVEGISDFYMDEVPGSLFKGLDQATKNKLDVYSLPSLSWDFVLNPIPNKAPYQVVKEGKSLFNPFAIREVRFALNYLMNRKYIVDEIQDGAGIPSISQGSTGQPNAWKLDLIAQKMGITAEGNKSKAIKDIDTAMKKAANLPENKGRLVKKGKFWYFDNEPVTVKFAIRVDDPEGRLKLGNYFADLVEEAGIKVEKKLWDRVKCVKTVYMSDPANYDWNLYTEGWGGGSTYIYWRVPTVQYLSTKYGDSPGWGEPTWWNFKNEEIDKLADDVLNGNMLTLDEYWDKIKRMTELGLNDAVRIFVTSGKSYFVANKSRFKERMYYGLGTEIDYWGLQNAKTQDNTLKIVQFSAAGGLFMHAWDPIGVEGFSDTYTVHIIQNLFEKHLDFKPTGPWLEKLAKVEYTKSKPYRDSDGKLKGKIVVPKDAIIYNHKTKKYEKLAKGTKAVGEAKFKITMSTWQHGRKVDINDYIYADAFRYDWAYKDGDNDKEFNQQYSTYYKETLDKVNVAMKIDSDDEITYWYNYNYPVDKLHNIGYLPSLTVQATSGELTSFPWELIEACAKLITEGSASGTVYGLTEKEGVNSLDLKSPAFLKDLKAKLNELIKEKHVPHILVGRVSPKTAVEDYKKVIKWIDTYHHAVIGNGPYKLTKIDAKTGFVELTAVRGDAYPFKQGYFENQLKMKRLKIQDIETPDMAMSGDEIDFNVNVSEVEYPSDLSKQANKGKVSLILVTKDGEKEIKGTFVSNGKFKIAIPEEISSELKAGTYTYVITASLGGIFVDTKTGTFEIY